MSVWQERVRRGLRPIDPYHVPPVEVAIKLDANESPFAPPAEFMSAVARAVRDAPIHRYPDPHASRLRSVIAADLAQPPERLVLGNGGDEIIGLLCASLAEPPADGQGTGKTQATVVFPAPSFIVFRTATLAAGMEPVEAPLGRYFQADADILSETIEKARPNLVFLATPNNPTGTVWSRGTVEELLKKHADTLFILDQAYVGYGGEDLIDLLEVFPNCAILRTYSKIGLAGLRIGVLVAPPELAHELEKVRPPYNIGILPQRVAEVAIGRFASQLRSHMREIAGERDELMRVIGRLPGVETFYSGANFFLARFADAGAVWQALLDRSILVRRFGPGRLGGCLRITVGTPEENAHLIEALHEIVRPGA
jgi:histidinol-phosphate aminotransferase